MANKVLILPLEIMHRELDARLLHALFALQRGWEVYLGANAVINRGIWKFPRGVFLLTTLTHNRLYLSRLLKKAGFSIQGWDEEGLVYKDRDVYLTRRVSSETLANVDQIFAWGEASARDMDIRAAKAGKRAIALGNPRLDLLRPELHPYHAAEVEKIHREIGDFLLFNTNFPSINLVVKREIPYHKRSSPQDQEFRQQAEKNYRSFIGHRQFMFRAFRDLLPALARALPAGMKLVVRPHPAENPDVWKELARTHSNMIIASEGSVVPWVMASATLLHNDCTTAVEARLLGKEPIAYIPKGTPENGSCFLPNAVSHQAHDLDGIMDFLAAIRDGNIDNAPLEAILDRHVSARRGKMAAERVVDHAEDLLARNENAGLAPPWQLKAFGLLRHGWKKLKARKRTDKYIASVFPSLPPSMLEERLSRLGEILNMPMDEVQIKRIGNRLFHLRKE